MFIASHKTKAYNIRKKGISFGNDVDSNSISLVEPMYWKKCIFFKCIVACVHLYICVYKSALTSSITTSGLWEPSREPHQPSPLMVTHMIHGFPRPFVFITPPRQLASCIAVSCNASKFGPEREERMSRGEVFLALKETKGLGFGMDKKLKAGWRTAVAAFFFFFNFC